MLGTEYVSATLYSLSNFSIFSTGLLRLVNVVTEVATAVTPNSVRNSLRVSLRVFTSQQVISINMFIIFA